MAKVSKIEQKTNEIMQYINTYLIKQYGEIQDEWQLTLMMLSDNLIMYQECMQSIKKYGIYNDERGLKNPLLSTVKDLQAVILKEIQHLGLTPYASSKIKQISEDDSDDFINKLIEKR